MAGPDDNSSEIEKKRRTQRNWAIAAMLFAFIVIIYVVTILRLSAAAG